MLFETGLVQSSNSMQTLELTYSHNIVAQSHVLIFVTPELARENLKPLVYRDADLRAKQAFRLFNNVLEFG